MFTVHWARPFVLIMIATWVAAVVGVWVVTDGLPPVTRLVMIIAAVAATTGFLIVAQYLAAAVRWRRSDRRWSVRAAAGSAAATARARHGGLTLYGIWAVPTGRGLGSQLMVRATADADHDGITLRLTAVNTAAATMYARHGFTTDQPRNLLRIPMKRTPDRRARPAQHQSGRRC